MKKIIIAAFLTPLASFASITISADFTYALNQLGNSVPVGSKAVIVADTLGDGFIGSTQGTSSSLLGETLQTGNFFGVDDQIVGFLDAYNPGTGTGELTNGYAGSISFSFGGNLGLNDALAIYFFPSVSDTSSTLTPGTFYGFFSQTGGFNVDAGGSIAMRAPADGNNETWAYYTPQFYADNGVAGSAFDPSQAELTSSIQIVPEPSTYAAIFGILALAIAYRRKN